MWEHGRCENVNLVTEDAASYWYLDSPADCDKVTHTLSEWES